MNAEEGRPRGRMIERVRERKERHKQRSRVYRVVFAVGGVLVILLGAALSLPGVPGPGLLLVVVGLGMLALEFDRAERLLERVIVWGERAAERAEQTTPRQRYAAAAAFAVALAVFAWAALTYDIPLMPIL